MTFPLIMIGILLLPLLLLVLDSGTWIAADAIFMGQSLRETYLAGGIVDSGWIAGYLLMGLAGIAHCPGIDSVMLKKILFRCLKMPRR